MEAEVVNEIERLVLQGQGFSDDLELPEHLARRSPAGSWELVGRPRGPESFKANTIDGVIGLIQDRLDLRSVDWATVLVGCGKIVATIGERRPQLDRTAPMPDRITCDLQHTDEWAFIEYLRGDKNVGAPVGREFNQRQLAWSLKTLFRSRIEPTDLVAQVENVKFENKEDGTSTVKSGEEGVSRKLVQQIRSEGGGQFPDSFKLRAGVYEQHSFNAEVEVALHVTGDGKFMVRVLAGELLDCRLAADKEIGRTISTAIPARCTVVVGATA